MRPPSAKRRRGLAKQWTVSNVQPDGCWQKSPPTRHSPAPRLSCDCSAMPREAACWLKKHSRHCAPAMEPTVPLSHAFLQKTSRFRRAVLNSVLSKGPTASPVLKQHSPNDRREALTPMSLKGKTLFITGGSRGIGLAIALKAAAKGANVAIAAKTVEPHPKLEGTIHTAAAAIEKAAGRALPLAVDVREEAAVRAALDETAAEFGGIDIVVNNASAIQLTSVAATDMKRYDLMMGI